MTTSKLRVENSIPPGRYTMRPATVSVRAGVMVATYETVDAPRPVTITETRKVLTDVEIKAEDDAFMAWCAAEKRCRYCGAKFSGPVCPCEVPG